MFFKLLFRAFATFIIASFLFVFIPMAFIIVVVLATIDDNVNLVNITLRPVFNQL